MGNIKRRRGLNRNSEVVIYDSGKKRVRCYTKMNPHYYKDEKGDLNPIDVGRVDITSTGIGDINLKSHNIVSLGIRRDGSTEKYLGMRPDETQALGTEQLEFTIVDVDFNGNKVPVDLSRNEIKTPNVMDFGSVVVHNTRQRSRQMVKVVGDISDFTIKYRIDMKGLEFTNKLTTKVNEVLRPNTVVKSTELGAVDSYTFVKEVDKDASGFEIISGSITNDHLWLTSTPQKTYSDIFPDGYTTHRWGISSCNPVSAKNDVILVIKESPITTSDLYTTIQSILIDITGGEADGLSIVKEGKIVALIGRDVVSNDVWVVIMCETPDYKNFNEGDIVDNVAPIGFTQGEITSAFLTTFNKAVNKSEIVLDGEYLVEKDDRFTITNSKDEFKFAISRPKLLDTNFNIVSDKTIHTLQKISNGVYEYIKYPDMNCFVGSEDVAYIDAEIVYGLAEDAWCGSPRNVTDTWDLAHDHAGSSRNILQNVLPQVSLTYLKNVWVYRVHRGFLFFDTSGVVGNVGAVSLFCYHATTAETWAKYMAQEGLQAYPLPDFTDFSTGWTGGSYGSVTPADNQYKEIVFNSTGIGNINQAGLTKICIRESDHDWDDVSPGFETTLKYTGDFVSSDSEGTDFDPYLEIEISEGIMPIMSVF